MKKNLFGLICLLFTILLTSSLYSCSSNEIIESNGLIIPEGGRPRAPDNPTVLFVKLAKKDNKWVILDIEKHRMPIDFNAGQERLFIQTANNTILPDYDYFPYRPGTFGKFECGNASLRYRDTTYNPCISAFAKNSSFGDGWFGWLKVINSAEIIKAATETNLVEKAKIKMASIETDMSRCDKMKSVALRKIDKEKITPRLIDETHMLKSTNIDWENNNIQITSQAGGCPASINNLLIKYTIKANGAIGNFVLRNKNHSDWKSTGNTNTFHKIRKFGNGPGNLRPDIALTSKTVNKYAINRRFADKSISIHWDKISLGNDGASFKYSLSNNSNYYVNVQSISFYVNGAVLTFNSTGKYPPNTTNPSELKASFYTQQIPMKSQKEIQKLADVKKDSPTLFGVSVEYNLNGRKETLYRTLYLKLSNIAKI